MTTRRWVYVHGIAYEIGVDEMPPANAHVTDGVLWGDRHYDGLRATDGADISTRTKHRAYMKANGLTTADDFTGEWDKAQRSRDEYRSTGKGGAVTREAIERAIHELEKQR